MQSLSFAIDIPRVRFRIAFPAMVLFVESRYLRTGDELYRTSAGRWSKVMFALFASGDHGKRSPASRWSTVVGIHRDVRLGLLARSCDRRVLVLRRRDLIGIYVYGWERLVSRLHLLSGIPAVSVAATSASAGAVRMGADPHWRVRRPPPDSNHQLRDTTRVRCDPDIAVPMTAEPQTAWRCPCPYRAPEHRLDREPRQEEM